MAKNKMVMPAVVGAVGLGIGYWLGKRGSTVPAGQVWLPSSPGMSEPGQPHHFVFDIRYPNVPWYQGVVNAATQAVAPRPIGVGWWPESPAQTSIGPAQNPVFYPPRSAAWTALLRAYPTLTCDAWARWSSTDQLNGIRYSRSLDNYDTAGYSDAQIAASISAWCKQTSLARSAAASRFGF